MQQLFMISQVDHMIKLKMTTAETLRWHLQDLLELKPEHVGSTKPERQLVGAAIVVSTSTVL